MGGLKVKLNFSEYKNEYDRELYCREITNITTLLGGRLRSMLGVKEIIASKKEEFSIKFNLPINTLKANRCTITLCNNDEGYNILFTSEYVSSKTWDLIVNVKKEIKNIPPENIYNYFESVTGLRLNL